MTEIPLDVNEQVPLGCPSGAQQDADHHPTFYLENGYGGEPVHFYVECSCGAISVIYEVSEPDEDGRPTTAASIHEDGLEHFVYNIADGLGYTDETVPHITLHGTPVHEEFTQSITLYE